MLTLARHLYSDPHTHKLGNQGDAMKLLVVEDEVKTGEYLRQGLAEAGFVVDLAANGLDGHHLAMSEAYDLIILDVMLPDVDGWRILETIRKTDKSVPVLFLTARDSVADRTQQAFDRGTHGRVVVQDEDERGLRTHALSSCAIKD